MCIKYNQFLPVGPQCHSCLSADAPTQSARPAPLPRYLEGSKAFARPSPDGLPSRGRSTALRDHATEACRSLLPFPFPFQPLLGIGSAERPQYGHLRWRGAIASDRHVACRCRSSGLSIRQRKGPRRTATARAGALRSHNAHCLLCLASAPLPLLKAVQRRVATACVPPSRKEPVRAA